MDLGAKVKYIINKILSKIDIIDSTFLDIGAGEGNFILNLISLGINAKNITAIEYLEDRYLKLKEKLPHIISINDDFLKIDLVNKYDVITILAVLTSITDNDIRYNIYKKALERLSLNNKGVLILYDYFDDNEKFLSDDYRALSLKKIINLSSNYNIKIYKKVYLKSRYAKGLCKINLQALIPLFESFKVFNDNYHFVVVSHEK